jgi:hypothetical protein
MLLKNEFLFDNVLTCLRRLKQEIINDSKKVNKQKIKITKYFCLLQRLVSFVKKTGATIFFVLLSIIFKIALLIFTIWLIKILIMPEIVSETNLKLLAQ